METINSPSVNARPLQDEIDRGVKTIRLCIQFNGKEDQWISDIMDEHDMHSIGGDDLTPSTCYICQREWRKPIDYAIGMLCTMRNNMIHHLRKVTVLSIFSTRIDWITVRCIEEEDSGYRWVGEDSGGITEEEDLEDTTRVDSAMAMRKCHKTDC